jgi:ABC-type glutathione transport system ATPase component
MALIPGPELLIADEPTTALDVTIQAQILELLARLRVERQLTLIFVTHDLAVVSNIADNVIVMRRGEIVEAGTSDRIFRHSEHPYTRDLLAAIPASAKPERFRNTQSPGASTDALLEIRSLKTWFPGVRAVDDVTLAIRAGEVLGLVGESGSGKSTLGRTVLRLADASDGSVLFDGADVLGMGSRELRQLRPQIQMIFQDPYASLNPRMTINDALAEPLLNYGFARRANVLDAVVRLIEDVGLSARDIRKYPHEFSGGQRQRIAIARALALRPRLIIADEPVSALDVTVQAQILELLLGLVQRYQLAMLFISHDLAVVRYMSDRTAVMYRGRIVEIDATENLFNAPQHAYTQQLLSAIPQL